MIRQWLLLVHQLPARPTNARVKTWRRLQDLGALAVKNSVYLLPNSPQAREDLEWIKTEVEAMKGQAIVFAADALDPGGNARSGDQIVAAFRAARQTDFDAVRRRAEALAGRGRQPDEGSARRLREQWTRIAKIDFFGARGRAEAAAALERLERRLKGGPRLVAESAAAAAGGPLKPADFRGRLWITRPRPGVDRMSSAWLIRRFIDPRAKFGFAARPQDAPPRSIPFDMFGVEFSHQGNQCTFETLARRFGVVTVGRSVPLSVAAGVGRSVPLSVAADLQLGVEWLSRIVHDLDLKESKYGEPEAPAVERMVEGLRQMYSRDQELLEQGVTMFEALYRSYAGKHPTTGRPRRFPKRRQR